LNGILSIGGGVLRKSHILSLCLILSVDQVIKHWSTIVIPKKKNDNILMGI